MTIDRATLSHGWHSAAARTLGHLYPNRVELEHGAPSIPTGDGVYVPAEVFVGADETFEVPGFKRGRYLSALVMAAERNDRRRR